MKHLSVPLLVISAFTLQAAEPELAHDLDGQSFNIAFTIGEEHVEETLVFDRGYCSSTVIEEIAQHKLPYSVQKRNGKIACRVGMSSPGGEILTYTLLIDGDVVSGLLTDTNDGIDLYEPAKITGKRTDAKVALDEVVSWQYTTSNHGADGVFDCDGFTFIIAGAQLGSGGYGYIKVGGVGSDGCSWGKQGGHMYENGVLTLTLNERTVRITDQGTKLHAGDQVIDLTGTKPTVTIAANGTVSVQKP
jgi:hypothetical protein